MTAAALVILATAALSAQEVEIRQAPAVRARPAGQSVPLKISLLLSRYQGEKKISSVPFVLWVTADYPESTRLRMGNQVPVTSIIFAGKEQQSSYTYKDVGTNIDCTASSQAEGYFRLNLTIADSSVYFPDRTDPTLAKEGSAPIGAPAFRSFTSSFYILVRDGQTVQYTSATDQVSGQVLKIDATLNVQK
jgi:hypothetical protein